MALWYLVPIISVVSSSWGGVEGFGKNQGGATAVPAGRAVTIGELDSVMNNIRNGVDAGAVIASGPLPLPSSKGNNSVLVSRGAFTPTVASSSTPATVSTPLPSSKGNNSVLVSRGAFTPTVASSSTPATVSTFGRSSSFSNGKGGISSTPATVSTFGRSSSPMSNGKGGSSSSGYSRSSNGSSNGNGGSSSNGNGGGISTFGRSIPNGGGVAPASSAPSKNLPPCKGCNNNYYPQNDNVVDDGVTDLEIIVRDPFNPDSILVDETIIVENNAAGSILNEIAQVPMAVSSCKE
ncbi:uncharacterized protein EMH_0043040 [Eimeria mitis]|uniref:Uncharacterized protein n=1 Tax=Eimeria mitis TaxID=44415 RepID=U6JV69_9EIME|nr:uncharacterized protein EMH_0043040 [Eimeria mitis]CDJ28681.1 hypothetical protein, conserved [Eimeria mitis]